MGPLPRSLKFFMVIHFEIFLIFERLEKFGVSKYALQIPSKFVRCQSETTIGALGLKHQKWISWAFFGDKEYG